MVLLYDRILRHKQIPVNKKDKMWNWSFNMPCKSLKGILVLFEEEKSYVTDTSKFYNPKIQNVSVTVEGNKKRSHTQLDSRKQVIAFQDRVITINIKEAQHPLKREKQVIDKSSIMLKILTKSMHRVLV